MKHTKKITILHSNDMHGDFLAEQLDNKLVGGVSMLSGYVEKVRREEKNVLYPALHRSTTATCADWTTSRSRG